MNRLLQMLKGEKTPQKESTASFVPTDRVAIRIDHLRKSYGSFEVLKDIDITVKEGESFGLIGRNGIGKSTTIDCLVGLKAFDGGSISIFDHDVLTETEKAKACFGYVASEPTAYEIMTGKEYLSFVAGAYGVSQKDFVENYRVLAARLSFNDNDLRKRPTVGLDLVVNEMLFNLMKDLKARGRTIFLTSHNIDFVSKICDSVGILDRGRIKRHIDFAKEPMERRKLKDIFRSFDVEEEKE